MQLQRVEITNFLGLRAVDLAISNGFQLIAGPNNAGKSSVIRLLETFFKGDASAFQTMLPLNEYYIESGARTLSEVRVWLGDLSDDETAAFGDAVLQRSGQLWVSVRCSKAGSISYRASRKLSADESEQLYREVLLRTHFVKVPSVRVGGAGDLDRPDSLERLLETLESTLVRSGTARSTNLQQRFSVQAHALEQLVEGVLTESATVIQEELPFEGGLVRFSLGEFRHALRAMLENVEIVSDDGTTVPVRMRGTGFQSALVLGVMRYVAEQEAPTGGNVIFAVEEPEAFLHPQTQRAMARVLRGIGDSAQLLVTTHSPILVDSFRITQSLRLPLSSDGLTFQWNTPTLTDAEEGRLTRWSNATNSELVFARVAVIVEGESDFGLVKFLLDDLSGGPNEHHARGISVLMANGLGNAKNLVELANHFGVPTFVLSDKDGLAVAQNQRRLLDVLASRVSTPDAALRQRLIALADAASPDYAAATATQQRLNAELRPFQAFVLSSDIEGALIDGLAVDWVATALGPEGENVLAQQFLDQLAESPDARTELGRRLGSKGWEQRTKPTNKMEPHLPRALVERFRAEGRNWPEEFTRLREWLRDDVIADTSAAASV